MLRSLHTALDAAVLAAYDFDPDVEILAQMLSMNLATAARERARDPVTQPGPMGSDCARTSRSFTVEW